MIPSLACSTRSGGLCRNKTKQKHVSRKEKHSHVVGIFSVQGDSLFARIFNGKDAWLEARLDVNYGLLAQLVQDGVIMNAHRTEIEVTFVTVVMFLPI